MDNKKGKKTESALEITQGTAVPSSFPPGSRFTTAACQRSLLNDDAHYH